MKSIAFHFCDPFYGLGEISFADLFRGC